MKSKPSMLCNVIQSEAFSNLGRHLRVTALVLKFIKLLKSQRQGDLFVCLFVFMLNLLQYCNYIIIVMQIKLMLLLLFESEAEDTCDRRRHRRSRTSMDQGRSARDEEQAEV